MPRARTGLARPNGSRFRSCGRRWAGRAALNAAAGLRVLPRRAGSWSTDLYAERLGPRLSAAGGGDNHGSSDPNGRSGRRSVAVVRVAEAVDRRCSPCWLTSGPSGGSSSRRGGMVSSAAAEEAFHGCKRARSTGRGLLIGSLPPVHTNWDPSQRRVEFGAYGDTV